MAYCKVKYFDQIMPKLEHKKYGDWIDVRACEVLKDNNKIEWKSSNDGKEYVKYEKFDDILIKLGFAMQFPSIYEAHVLPRSSLYKRRGLILVNGMGVIDHTYRGNNDEWLFPVLAMRSGILYRHERIGQFRLIERMKKINFIETEKFNCEDRNGYGMTGTE